MDYYIEFIRGQVFFWSELIMNRKINSFAQKYRVEELSSVVSLVESSEWLEVEKDELVSLTEADQLIIDEDVLVDSILRYTDRLIDEHLYNRNLPSPRPPPFLHQTLKPLFWVLEMSRDCCLAASSASGTYVLSDLFLYTSNIDN